MRYVSAVLLEGVVLVALGGVVLVAAVGLAVAEGGMVLVAAGGVGLVAVAFASAGAVAREFLTSSGGATLVGGIGSLLTAGTAKAVAGLPSAWSNPGSVFVVGRAFCRRSIDAAFWVGLMTSVFTPPTFGDGTGEVT